MIYIKYKIINIYVWLLLYYIIYYIIYYIYSYYTRKVIRGEKRIVEQNIIRLIV